MKAARIFLVTRACSLPLSAPAQDPGPQAGSRAWSLPSRPQLQEQLQAWLRTETFPPEIRIRSERLRSPLWVQSFYEKLDHQAAWTDGNGPKAEVVQLIQALRIADQEGLDPTDYHLLPLISMLVKLQGGRGTERDAPQHRQLAELDLLCTDAFMTYASHLLAGRLNLDMRYPTQTEMLRARALPDLLAGALRDHRLEEVLRGFIPTQEGYRRLKRAREDHLRLAAEEGRGPVPDPVLLRPGQRDPVRLPFLRRRLRAFGDLPPGPDADADLFDPGLEGAIRRFQTRNGLPVTGVLDPAGWEQVSRPLTERVRTIELNLERWRWLPREFGNRYVLVNIPAYDLAVWDRGREALRMRVVVGQTYRPTPVFSDRISSVVLNPVWEIPPAVMWEDKLKAVLKDPEHFEKNQIQVFSGWGDERVRVDPRTIAWDQVRNRDLYERFTFRQTGGPANPLGRIKFMFPNQFNVYLHDTPKKELFDKEVRNFSSGCIRVEAPVDLAAYLNPETRYWTRELIAAEIQNPLDTRIKVPRPIPVHIVYWTAWAEEDGTVRFRPDIYGLDRRMDRLLQQTSARSGDTGPTREDMRVDE